VRNAPGSKGGQVSRAALWLNFFVAHVQTGLDWTGEIAGNKDPSAPMEQIVGTSKEQGTTFRRRHR
jgi:hypothetical protein